MLVRSEDAGVGSRAVGAYFAAKDAALRRVGAVDMSDSDGEPDASDAQPFNSAGAALTDSEASYASSDDDDAASLASGGGLGRPACKNATERGSRGT